MALIPPPPAELTEGRQGHYAGAVTRAVAFGADVGAFLAQHDRIFVVEQNRDAQLRALLLVETTVPKDKLRSVLAWGGFPMQASFVADSIARQMEVRPS